MMFLSQLVRQYLLALQFFTRIPVTGRLADWVGYSPDLLRASAGHFPGVGILVGVVAASVFFLFNGLLPETSFSPFVAAALSTVATMLLTGGFHEDGLADLADGLGGSMQRERALEIMKDSRVGAFGVMALVLSLLVKIGLLVILALADKAPGGWMQWTALADAAQATGDSGGETGGGMDGIGGYVGWYVGAALFAAHVVSRALPLAVIYWLPYVGDTGASKSKPLADAISAASLLTGFLWCFIALALVSAVLDAFDLIAACGFAMVAMLWMGRLFKRRLQGFTGDCLGATQQVCEIAFYLGLAVSF